MSDQESCFHFSCPNCQQPFTAEIHDIGSKAICPSCGKEITIGPRGPLFDDLNFKQKMATLPIDGIIRVAAGAGTGKTRVLVHRLAYLIHCGIPPMDILSVTFTNKAAGVMKKRAKAFLGPNVASRISTFHGFCHELLKEDIHAVNFPPNFRILDTKDQDQILEEIYSENGISGIDITHEKALHEISKAKHSRPYPYVPYLTKTVFNEKEKFIPINEQIRSNENIILIIINEYLLKQRKNFALDFDDLILFAIHILANFPDIKSKWNDRIRYIQVDEFQDVNLTQWDLLTLLLGNQNNLYVVGDPDQSIYRWRGAEPKIFLHLPDFAETVKQKFTDMVLDDNYRSFQSILDISNQMIANNTQRIHKNLHAVKGCGNDKSIFFHAPNNIKEAAWIASQIKTLISQGNVHCNDIAILLRSLSHSKVLEDALRKNNIPYQIINGLHFYERKEIKDALSYLRLIADGDDLSFKRIINDPPRGIGKTRVDFLKQYAQDKGITLWESFKRNAGHGMFSERAMSNNRPKLDKKLYNPITPVEFVKIIKELRKELQNTTVSDILIQVLRKTGYEAYILQSGDEERKDNLSELISGILQSEKEAEERIDLHNYLNEIAIYSEQQENPDAEMVKIMTIHTSKGQEFPFVFVPFFNERIIPSRRAIRPEEIEEERRVAYVAFTRAEKQLFISNSDGNLIEHYLLPSRFLLEIEKEFLRVEGVVPASYWEDATKKINDMLQSQTIIKSLKIGDEINHPVFGLCKIISIYFAESLLEIQLKSGEIKRITTAGLNSASPSIQLEPATGYDAPQMPEF